MTIFSTDELKLLLEWYRFMEDAPNDADRALAQKIEVMTSLEPTRSSPGVRMTEIDEQRILVVHPNMPPYIYNVRTETWTRIEVK